MHLVSDLPNGNSETPWLAPMDLRVPEPLIRPGLTVRVPVWSEGRVLGWAAAVVAGRRPDDGGRHACFDVRYVGNGSLTIMYSYSIARYSS